jgi:hypothetical protein
VIAKVRIATWDRWCDSAKNLLERCSDMPGTAPVGNEIIGIDTSSMRQSSINCGGREWRVVSLPSNVIGINPASGEQVNLLNSEGWICEHMLEMD